MSQEINLRQTQIERAFAPALIVLLLFGVLTSRTHAQVQQWNYVKVSPGVVQSLLIYHVPPVYPERAKLNHIQGVVVLSAVIGKDGHVKNLSVISGPTELCQAALDAAKQWRYRPYILNDRPVEIESRINLTFSLISQK